VTFAKPSPSVAKPAGLASNDAPSGVDSDKRYLRSCESDVFISYSHFDNETMFEQRGWIEVLHEALKVRLKQLLGEELVVWRDPKLSGNEYFEDTLEKRLLKTALLLSVISPRYVKSESCLKEIEAFCLGAAQSGGLRFQDKARLLKVVKTRVAREQMPPPLQHLLGYEFYAIDQAERPREYRLPPAPGDESYQACLQKLEDLAYDIKETLEALRAREMQTPGKDENAPRVIYIADTISNLRAQSEQLRRELRQRGYVVFPCEAAPEDGPRYRDFVAGQLQQASVSVHLLGELYGVTLEGETRSTIDVQIDEAGRIAATGALQRVLWLPEKLEPKEKRQEDFLGTLRRDAANEAHTELLETSIENLKTYLLRKLAETPKPPAGVTAAGAPLLVYLIHDQRDVEAIQPLRDALMARGYEVKPSYFEGGETELREYHQENLVQCEGAIIYYGAANEFWVQRKLSDLRKAFGLGRERPYRAKAVFVGLPSKPEKERFRTQEAIVIQASQTFSAEALEPFLVQWGPRP
jgi:hypothetical protein